MIESFLRSLPIQNRLTWLLAFFSIAFLTSGIWLGFAISRGVRSNNWTETKGVIGDRRFGLGQRRAKRFRWRLVKVDYSFDGRPFSRFVRVFSDRQSSKIGNSITIYVNPDRPTELTSAPRFPSDRLRTASRVYAWIARSHCDDSVHHVQPERRLRIRSQPNANVGLTLKPKPRFQASDIVQRVL